MSNMVWKGYMNEASETKTTYLDMKGTALSRFKINHASVLDVGLTATRGSFREADATIDGLLLTLTIPPKLFVLLYSFAEGKSAIASSSAIQEYLLETEILDFSVVEGGSIGDPAGLFELESVRVS